MKKFKAIIAALSIFAVLLSGGCGQSSANEMPAGILSEKVRIALIDSGISSRAIDTAYTKQGYNYILNNENTEDTYGHGTAVASVILDYCENVVLIPLVDAVYEKGRINAADSELLARIITDAVDIYDCNIINISEGLSEDSSILKEAVDYALSKGVMIVSAVGNDYKKNPDKKYYPAAYEGVISVGALDKSGNIAEFSQKWAIRNEAGVDIPVKLLSGNASTSDGASLAAAIATGKLASDYFSSHALGGSSKDNFFK